MLVDKTLTSVEKAAGEAMTAVALARKQMGENAAGYQAKGKALADLAISEARGQGSAWGRFYRDMLELEAEGRKAFRSAIAAHQKAMQAHVKANSEGEKDNPAFATAKRSGMVRLSELTSISKALDNGGAFDKAWPFHYAVGIARTLNGSQAQGRGRPAKPWMDKVKEFLAKNVPAGEWDKAVELVETMAEVKE